MNAKTVKRWRVGLTTTSPSLFVCFDNLLLGSFHVIFYALRYILYFLLATENTFLLFEVNVLKYVSYSKHFLNYHLLLWRLETTFQTMDESQSKNNHEWDHYTIFYWADKIINIK